MPHKRKRLFTKNNSVKYLLLPGNENATNADGEVMTNMLVPVTRNYKPGTSLLCGGIPECFRLDQEDDDEVDDQEDESLASRFKDIHIDSQNRKSTEEYIIESADDEDDEPEDENYLSDIEGSDGDRFSDDIKDMVDVFQSSSAKDDCPENVKIFNERFEKVLEEYDDDQIGALDDEDIHGHLTTEDDMLGSYLGLAYAKAEEEIVLGGCEASLKERILDTIDDSGDEKIVEIVTEEPPEFDCESILSTYSNIYNHPTIIKEPKVDKIKINIKPAQRRLTKGQLKQLDSEHSSESEMSDDECSVVTSCNFRPKGETLEQKKERKALFKEAKRESRIMKKENKLAFKHEKKLQRAQAINAQRTAGIKLH